MDISNQAEEWIATLPIETPSEVTEQYLDPAMAMKISASGEGNVGASKVLECLVWVAKGAAKNPSVAQL